MVVALMVVALMEVALKVIALVVWSLGLGASVIGVAGVVEVVWAAGFGSGLDSGGRDGSSLDFMGIYVDSFDGEPLWR